MTPRKEVFIKMKQSLSELTVLELVDLQRKQFSQPKENYPSYFTAALIEIKAIDWQTMVEQRQEGKATVDVIFYCKDGWMDQHNDTTDPEKQSKPAGVLSKDGTKVLPWAVVHAARVEKARASERAVAAEPRR